MTWQKQGVVFVPGAEIPWMGTHAAAPFVDHLEGDVYRIYFSSRDGMNRAQIGFIDVDVTRFSRIRAISAAPVVGLGARGTFDDSGALGGCIVNHGRQKYLYYSGWNVGGSVPFRNAIGLAISHDAGRTFTRCSEGPILDRSIHDPGFAAGPYVLIEGGTWRMWYSSCVGWRDEGAALKHYYHIKYAESENGIDWKRHGRVCIDFQSADEYAIAVPCILRDGRTYKMWYSHRGRRYRIGYAESLDGLSWKRLDDRVGLDVSASGDDSDMIEYPCVFDHGGTRFMLYNGNDYGKTGICLAVLREA